MTDLPPSVQAHQHPDHVLYLLRHRTYVQMVKVWRDGRTMVFASLPDGSFQPLSIHWAELQEYHDHGVALLREE